MPGKKQKTKYKRKRKKIFTGTRRQETGRQSEENVVAAENVVSPVKLSKSEEKLKRNCPLTEIETNEVLTRSKTIKLGRSHTTQTTTTKIHDNKLVDSTLPQNFLFNSAVCSSCKNKRSKLELWQDNSRRQGLKETLFSKCTHCGTMVSFDTSNISQTKHIEVNVRLVQAGLVTGNGLSSLQKLCGILNLPKFLTTKNYNKILKHLAKESIKGTETVMKKSVENLKEILDADGKIPDNDGCYHLAVTLDGTWQKRYGFNCLHGVIFLMSVLTGKVIDYVVRSKVCFECQPRKSWNKNTLLYCNWYTSHKESCTINHTKSSEPMEKDLAILMFQRSVELYHLKHTLYVGDGDSSSFKVVRETMENTHGNTYCIEKEDCIGHIQKRMGSNLRNYKKMNNKKLKDGLGVGGKGRLTDAFIDRLQNYYGAAIRNNIGNLKEMENSIWAIYYHSIRGEKESLCQQHHLCPTGTSSWCIYQKDISNKTNNYDQSYCLPPVFREELKPLFTRMSNTDLLKRCLRGLTQNQNKAINSILWKKCPKNIFCGFWKLSTITAQTVSYWNQGSASSGIILNQMGISDIGVNTNQSFRYENDRRLTAAAQKISKYKKQRQLNRQNRKRKRDEGSYKSGAHDL